MIANDLLHLKNMLDAMDAIERHKSSAAPLATMQVAIAFEIIKMGEAASQLTSELKKVHPQVPWRIMSDTRNRFIHGYYEIDYAILWDIVNDHLPGLYPEIVSIIKSIEC